MPVMRRSPEPELRSSRAQKTQPAHRHDASIVGHRPSPYDGLRASRDSSWGISLVRAQVVGLVLVAIVAGGCGEAPGLSLGPISQTPAPTTAPSPGEPLVAGPSQSAAACRQELTADVAAAKRIRSDLRVPGIDSSDTAIGAAANDPAADVSMVGIPLTHPELAALHASGLSLGGNPLSEWVEVGEPARFGGIWIDPPGSDRYVVSILASDPGAMGLAQCLGTGVDLRFVAADTSGADLKALVDRIGGDLDQLRSNGISIASAGIGVRKSVMVVIVGVTGLTDVIRAKLVAQYGSNIVIEEQAPAQPL
jgi:hypothetical protein